MPRSMPLTARRALEALAATILTFASVHVLILLAEALFWRDASGLNVFTMLEAQRLWPALGSGPGIQALSLVFALMVYGSVFAFALARPDEPLGRRLARARRRRVLHALRAHGAGAARSPESPAFAKAPGLLAGASDRPARAIPLAFGFATLVTGLAFHMFALGLIERFVPAFPSIPDVVHERLPYVDFGAPGEMVFFAFLLGLIVTYTWRQPRTLPTVLVLLGVFYAIRGVFLFLLPIGVPPTAPPTESRFVFWPFANHAYFPGGHAGMMTILSLAVDSRPLRRLFLAVTIVFAFGTLLARTHYAADALGGGLLGYAITLWGRRRFGSLAGGRAGGRTEAGPTASPLSRRVNPAQACSARIAQPLTPPPTACRR